MNLQANFSTPCFNQFCRFWRFVNFVPCRQPTQPQRHLAQVLVVLLCVFLPTQHPEHRAH